MVGRNKSKHKKALILYTNDPLEELIKVRITEDDLTCNTTVHMITIDKNEVSPVDKAILNVC